MTTAGPITPVSTRSIPIMETSPDSIKIHRIEDHELETFFTVARPYSLALSTTCAGAAIGLLPSIMTIFDKAARGLSQSDIATVIVAAFCLASALIFGVYAIRGLVDANATLKRIRARPAEPC